MRVLKWSPWLAGLGLVAVAFMLSPGQARADARSDQTGSIVIFPKVIADGTRDTLIELTNTSNLPQDIHCIYVNGGGVCQLSPSVQCDQDSDCPGFAGGEQCAFAWQEANFDVTLTRQQPTIWRVSTGRIVDATDPVLDPTNTAADSCEDVTVGATVRQTCPGIDPGNVIVAPAQPFRGELKCFEVDASGVPVASNAIKGEAILETIGSPQISKYNSINIRGNNVNADLALNLNNTEYGACPSAVEFETYADGADDLITSALDSGSCTGGCPVRTEITIVPCTENIEAQQPTQLTASFTIYDEQESPISESQNVTCWYNSPLDQIGNGVGFSSGSGTFRKIRIQSAPGRRCVAGPSMNALCASDADCGGAANGGVCGASSGLLAIVEEFHDSLASTGTAAINVHTIGGRTGICRVGGASCSSDAGCASGLCRADGAACTTDSQCLNGALDRCDLCVMDSIDVPAIVP